MIRLIKKSDYNKCCDIYNYYVINTSISFDLKPLTYIEYENKINKIIVPKGTLAAYKSATNWSAYADKMVEATE